MILSTERLYLREMEPSKFEALGAMLQDKEVMYAYEHAFSDEEAWDWLNRQISRYQSDGFGLWGMIQKTTGQLIGQCGLTWQDFNGKQVLEVGYLLRKDCWRRGYATEAAIACKEYAFDVLHAGEVYSIIRDTNTASQNVARRNGMKIVGQLVKHYYHMDMPHLVFCAVNPHCSPQSSHGSTDPR